MKKPSITETMVSFYTLSDFGTRVQASGAAKNRVMVVLDPVSAFSFQISNDLATWIYKKASAKYQVNVKLRDYFLPADRIVISLNTIKTKLSAVVAFMPETVCKVFPLDLLCQDVANLADRTESVLKLRPRILACMSHTASIAQEVVVLQIAAQVKTSAQAKAVELLAEPLARALPAGAPPSSTVVRRVNQATAMLPVQAAKSSAAKSLFGFLATKAIEAVGEDSNIYKLATSAAQHFDVPAEANSNIDEPKQPADAVLQLMHQSVGAAGDYITEAANKELAKNVEEGLAKLTAELIKKEGEFLVQAREVVIDNAATMALAYAISTGVGWYILPNVTKQFLNLFVPEAVSETIASAVSWGSLVCTGISYFNNVSAYRADRKANQNRFAPLSNVENVVTTGVTQQVEELLPAVIAERNSFFGEFRSRCLKELPQVFTESGAPEIKK